ncbi:Fic family protein [Pseudonocardia sp. NPDC046786]|uniref:type II toxin-antitoxin system death-on-curing family toxin n=1 Tax=Pseudonocardia sp. NPDC046786 TaxID=3155471 RepID=UPI00340DB34F
MVRDFGLLESALARPATTVLGQEAYPTVHLEAAALPHSVCTNHAPVDGNERLAWVVTAVCLVLNGERIRTDQDAVFDLVIAVSEARLRELDLIAAALRGLTDGA